MADARPDVTRVPSPPRRLASVVVHPARKSVEPDADGFRQVQSRRRWRRVAVPRHPVPAALVGKCFNCLATDHVRADCTFPSRFFNCEREGHHERDCPLPPVTGRPEGKCGRSPARTSSLGRRTPCPGVRHPPDGSHPSRRYAILRPRSQWLMILWVGSRPLRRSRASWRTSTMRLARWLAGMATRRLTRRSASVASRAHFSAVCRRLRRRPGLGPGRRYCNSSRCPGHRSYRRRKTPWRLPCWPLLWALGPRSPRR